MKYETKMFLLAVLVILCFASIGITIGFRQYLLSFGLFLLGFILMGFGLKMKRKQGL
ncbi:DUF5325 family protein [Salinibacillus xinjiangensis]|uniref:YlaF family protein n=1 Tax=Salinibacillus xinjiangensis TaxID=1229268 RepID=A0A6G1X3Q9_9BACI|nr:DUF5325 family protein [Salinibacillus xinjiangensis]MRG85545.1 hypothetical protein [Salinibacillus xinjiangensis]